MVWSMLAMEVPGLVVDVHVDVALGGLGGLRPPN